MAVGATTWLCFCVAKRAPRSDTDSCRPSGRQRPEGSGRFGHRARASSRGKGRLRFGPSRGPNDPSRTRLAGHRLALPPSGSGCGLRRDSFAWSATKAFTEPDRPPFRGAAYCEGFASPAATLQCAPRTPRASSATARPPSLLRSSASFAKGGRSASGTSTTWGGGL